MSEFAVKDGGPQAATAEDRTVTATPRVDVLETENEFVLLADLPGVKPDDVDLRFDNGELTVHGRRPSCHAGKCSAHREHPATDYQRTFAVADTVAADRITAELNQGGLRLMPPKAERKASRRIEIKSWTGQPKAFDH